jgi:hypothetical protein
MVSCDIATSVYGVLSHAEDHTTNLINSSRGMRPMIFDCIGKTSTAIHREVDRKIYGSITRTLKFFGVGGAILLATRRALIEEETY